MARNPKDRGIERDISIRTSFSVNRIREFCVETGLCTEENKREFIDGDWEKGFCYMVKENKPKRLVEKKRYDKTWDKSEGADEALPNFDFDAFFQGMEEKR